MIGRINGILEIKKPPFLLIDVGGVGYEVQVSLSTFAKLPAIKQSVVLMTHLYVREDAQVLYGFYDEAERALFRALIKVSGVGPKLALTILSGISVPQFIQCVEGRDYAPLVRLPGVGKKTAERLIVEMAGKLKTSFAEEFEYVDVLLPADVATTPPDTAEKEAIAALIALGYKPQEASLAINTVTAKSEESLNSQELIRQALRAKAREQIS
jgi:holliday junction DNA helicase RuvA